MRETCGRVAQDQVLVPCNRYWALDFAQWRHTRMNVTCTLEKLQMSQRHIWKFEYTFSNHLNIDMAQFWALFNAMKHPYWELGNWCKTSKWKFCETLRVLHNLNRMSSEFLMTNCWSSSWIRILVRRKTKSEISSSFNFKASANSEERFSKKNT